MVQGGSYAVLLSKMQFDQAFFFTYFARGSHIMITYTRKNHFVENYVYGGPVRDPIGVILKNHGGHWQKEWHQESIWKRVPTDKRLIAAMKKIKDKINLHFLCSPCKNYHIIVTILTVKDLQRPGRPKLATVKNMKNPWVIWSKYRDD